MYMKMKKKLTYSKKEKKMIKEKMGEWLISMSMLFKENENIFFFFKINTVITCKLKIFAITCN